MEFKLQFMLREVPVKLVRPYMKRFVERYCTVDTLYPDVVRYVCLAIHPSNNVLRSGNIQRWEWLCNLLLMIPDKSYAVGALCKTALLYDWLHYDAKLDLFMNIGSLSS